MGKFLFSKIDFLKNCYSKYAGQSCVHCRYENRNVSIWNSIYILSVEIVTSRNVSTPHFSTMSFSDDEENSKFEPMEIVDLDKSKYLSKNRKIIIMVGLIIGIVILLVIAIPLATIFVNSKFIETKWNETFIQLNDEFRQEFTQLNAKIGKLENHENRIRGMIVHIL